MNQSLNLIFSKGCAGKITDAVNKSKRSGEVLVSCNFNSTPTRFLIERFGVYYEHNRKQPNFHKQHKSGAPPLEYRFLVPPQVSELCYEKNMAYEVSIQPKGTSTPYGCKWNGEIFRTPLEGRDPLLKNHEAVFIPLVLKADDSNVFKLQEPNLEKEVIGPILEMMGMKMHITQGYKTSYEFSYLLASSTKIKKGSTVLDMFMGLGYSSKKAIQLGAEKVFAFEKYNEVIELVKRNSKFSVDLQSPHFILHKERLDLKSDHNKFFNALKEQNLKFDCVIVDPPRRGVMLDVYSTSFLKELSSFVKPGGLVSAYVPEGTSQRFQSTMKDIVSVFESTTSFKLSAKPHEFIRVFERTK